jgi:hypothetical protein
MGWMTKEGWFNFQQEKEISLLHSIQTGSRPTQWAASSKVKVAGMQS